MYKKKYILGLIICFIHSYVVNNFYRPYIFKNGIYDFGIADIGNNISFIPGLFFLLYLLRKKFIFSKNKDIILHFSILCLVEFLSYFIPHFGTFDLKDIVGLFIGAIMLYFYVRK